MINIIKNRNSEKNYKCLLDMSSLNARTFLFKQESYCSLALPPYFVFDKLINSIEQEIQNKDLKIVDSKNFDDVNHVILNNKDGKYAWRPFQLIHPVLYVSLVHQITKKENWEIINERFRKFSSNTKIVCFSLPVESLDSNSDKAQQILCWLHEVEQKSIELALEFEYLIKTDITDCYSSIYTHSIAWALHDKSYAKVKENRHNMTLIGNIIDTHLQGMSYGQTNGIPQGSVLMDFIAEILLGYSDLQLSEKIEENGISDYKIIRHRDDYRIFINNQQDGKKILKLLSDVLSDLGLKLNNNKTEINDQVIVGAIKQDKLYCISQKILHKNLQTHILAIYEFARTYNNSGSLIKMLNVYHKKIKSIEDIARQDLISIISILVDIAFNNPRTYPIAMAIFSDLIKFYKDEEEKLEIIKKVQARFRKIPNTEYLEIWLQRITFPAKLRVPYENKLSKLVEGKNAIIWNSEWLKDIKLKTIIKNCDIIDKVKLNELTPIIENEEISLFCSQNWES